MRRFVRHLMSFVGLFDYGLAIRRPRPSKEEINVRRIERRCIRLANAVRRDMSRRAAWIDDERRRAERRP